MARDPELKGQKLQPHQQEAPVQQQAQAGIEPSPQPVCPQVAQQQSKLEKDQAGIPHQWGSPPQGQQQLAQQQLSPKKAESAAEQREANQQNHSRAPLPPGCQYGLALLGNVAAAEFRGGSWQPQTSVCLRASSAAPHL